MVGGVEGEGENRRFVLEWDDGDESDTVKEREEVCVCPRDGATGQTRVYKRVRAMTCQDVVEFVTNIDGLAQYEARLREERLDGEGLMQLAWLLDPPELVEGAEAQVGGVAIFMRVVRMELGIEKQAHSLRLAQHIRKLCAGVW